MKHSIPYGKSYLEFDIEPSREKKKVKANNIGFCPTISETELVVTALKKPVKSARLCELAVAKDKITIITSDHTRPLPSYITMPLLLDEIRTGNPDAEITILIATGMHRTTNSQEIVSRFGKEIAGKEKIIVHDAYDEENLTCIGKTTSGLRVSINKTAVTADLLISEGLIEPHFFAGYSGGRKAVLPGIASYRTIMENHCSKAISNHNAKASILINNPISNEMLESAKLAKLAFILNIVLDDKKKINAAFAGELEAAHQLGCDYCYKQSCINVEPADIVITGNGGYPLDQNLYQSVKCMSSASEAVKDGGILIVAAECCDGCGSDVFYNTFANNKSPQNVVDKILLRNKCDTLPDQWQIQIFGQILAQHKIVMVTSLPNEIIEHMGMIAADSIENAIKIAEKILKNNRASIAVIPNGAFSIIRATQVI